MRPRKFTLAKEITDPDDFDPPIEVVITVRSSVWGMFRTYADANGVAPYLLAEALMVKYNSGSLELDVEHEDVKAERKPVGAAAHRRTSGSVVVAMRN